MKTEFPSMSQEPIEHVDAYPDEDYPLRILRAYRENCNVRWEVSGLSPERTRVWDVMNEAQEERAKILDRAIAMLEAKR